MMEIIIIAILSSIIGFGFGYYLYIKCKRRAKREYYRKKIYEALKKHEKSQQEMIKLLTKSCEQVLENIKELEDIENMEKSISEISDKIEKI